MSDCPTHKVEQQKCPACSHPLNAATSITSNPNHPRPGDITVCFYCGEILTWREDLTLRVIEEHDLSPLSCIQRQLLDTVSHRIIARRTE